MNNFIVLWLSIILLELAANGKLIQLIDGIAGLSALGSSAARPNPNTSAKVA